MTNTINNYGINVFNDSIMRERLPKDIYKKLKKTIEEGTKLDSDIANIIANAMKDWAIEKGATHYTHWFQPLTGATAEKHDSFVTPYGIGLAVQEFSGKELVQGEPDASSFPSGGLRATFEARGYTAWDCTSPAFLKEDEVGTTLCIPTAFYSYTGEALDKKTPLLRSMEALSEQALRILKIFGNTTATRVLSTVGPEQEYFLIDREFYEQRLDLITCGRTLFGAPAPKGQELDDHYFGSIRERISAYMAEVDEELWKLGVPAKTKHNEVAPAQYEVAVTYNTTNVATDHNQLVMEILKKVAIRHDLVCLLHEKPFAGVNGSGKHNNWSLSSNDGQNLLDPGKTPHENLQFLLFLLATLAAVDENAELLRATATNAGNDHRLGANEAPPAIISAFIGDQLAEILEGIEKGKFQAAKKGEELNINIKTMPELPKDNTDRNRTSPFAFTGNKFEFRMVPSSASIAGPNVALNASAAAKLSEIADELEQANEKNIEKTIQDLLVRLIKKHKKIIFNGNNYADDWIQEAAKRGLANINNTIDANKAIISEKTVTLLEGLSILSKKELHSRYEVYQERYALSINIEAQTMTNIVNRQIIPAVSAYLSEQLALVFQLNESSLPSSSISALVQNLSQDLDDLISRTKILEKIIIQTQKITDLEKQVAAFRDNIVPAMNSVRKIADGLEVIVAKEYWPLPTYAEMLFLS